MLISLIRKTPLAITFSFLLLLLACAEWAFCTEELWRVVPIRSAEQKAAGLSGGEGFQMVHAIAYAPSNPSIAYFATDTSQLWKSCDGGSSWQPKNSGFGAHGARSIVVDSRNPDIVFAAGFLGESYDKAQQYKKKLQGIYRTVDGGAHWTFLKKTDFYKQESKGCLFAFDSTTCTDSSTRTVYVGSHSEGLLRSDDGGNTWRCVGFRDQRIIDMAEDPGRRGELLVATEDGLYRFVDGLARRIGKGLLDWPRSIAISEQAPQYVYAAVGKAGVFKSVDGGARFEPSSSGLPRDTNFTDIAVSPVNSNIVYVKTHRSGHRPFYSHDGAKSWHVPVSTNIGNLLLKEGFYWSSPIEPHPTEPMTVLAASNGMDNILKSEDGGRNWAYSGSGFTGGRMRDIAFAEDGKMIFCLTDFGLWVTDDRGTTFRELNAGRMFGSQSSYSGGIRGSTIVASLGTWGRKSLIVSRDLGKTWQRFANLTDSFDFIAFHNKKDDVVYAGPYRSLDGGKTWEQLSQTVRAMYPRDGDTVYALLASGDDSCFVLKSSNQGGMWTRPYPPCPFPAKSVNDITVAPDDSGRICLATSHGFWLFDGREWVSRNAQHGLVKDSCGMCYLSSLAIDNSKPNRIYAGRRAPGCGQSNGVFRSDDRGLTWENVTYNLGPALTVWAVEISPVDSSVYIGTSLGTFRLVDKPS